MSAPTLTMMRHAPRVALSRRHAARVHAAATAEAAAPADLTSTTISLPRLQFAPRGRMTREVDGVTLTVRYKAKTKVVSVVDEARGVSFPVSVGADQVVRYDPGHPSPVKPVGGLDGLGALQLGTLSEAAEVINYRAAMVGLLGVVLDDRSLGQQVFSGSLFSAVFVVAFVTAASLAPFVAGVVDADELFPNEMNPYENERLPEFWTPAAEKLNGRVAAVAFALIALHELF